MMENSDIESIKYGEEYKDIITGFKGFVTSKHMYVTGCHQVGLAQKVNKEGIPGKHYSFDITRLKRVGKGVRDKLAPAVPERGGPQSEPERQR